MKNRIVFYGVQTKWMAALAGIICLTVTAGVSAEQNAKPCAGDAAKLCPDVPQGEGRVAHCLKQHANELSPACKEKLVEIKEKVQDFKQACEADANKHCKDTKPGGGRILQCLKQHEGELSPACKEQMEQPRGRK